MKKLNCVATLTGRGTTAGPQWHANGGYLISEKGVFVPLARAPRPFVLH